MDIDIEFFGEIDEYEDGGAAQIVLYSKGVLRDEIPAYKGQEGHLSYHWELIPELGNFGPAKFRVTISTTADSQGVPKKRNPEVSIIESEAKALDVGSWGWECNLYDRTTEEWFASAILESAEYIPASIEKEGDQCYLTIQLEYDHELTKEVTGASDERIEELRAKWQERLQEWFGE